MLHETEESNYLYVQEDDALTQLKARLAESLSGMSTAHDSPLGVETCAPFGAEGVDFTADGWMSRLADTQGWLHFNADLSLTSTRGFTESLLANLGFDRPGDEIEPAALISGLSEAAFERLCTRAELAQKFQQDFLTNLDTEGSSRSSATTTWVEQWEAEDDNADAVVPEPVTAKADVWHIFQLTKKRLNLAPSYQRGDVWRTGDRQALIESILRGIPLPSIILLRTGGTTPHDVVDGKQRLTAILRFVGKHPVATAKVAEADLLHPEAEFGALFANDYPKFRKAWKAFMGEPLTAKLEDDFYFPFKLRSDTNGGLVGAELEALRGRYFTEIRENTIHVADQEVTVEELFEGAPDYKVPVIEYTKASQRQIHEVFKLYNKQGMHLNAEEIRNAVYHDIELTRAILVAAGDANPRASVAEVAPSLAGSDQVIDLGKNLADYGFGEARYRRTKVLGWIVAVLINDTQGKSLLSTARHTDLLLGRVQQDPAHALRDGSRIADLFDLVSRAAEIHASYDELWPDKFRGDGKSSKWQDLQLVGSLVGMVISLAGDPDGIERRIESSVDAIRDAATTEWARPAKAQTRTQWDFIARIALGVVDKLNVDLSVASDSIRVRFGSSGVESLKKAIIADSDE